MSRVSRPYLLFGLHFLFIVSAYFPQKPKCIEVAQTMSPPVSKCKNDFKRPPKVYEDICMCC
jgi:hypothetical protein